MKLRNWYGATLAVIALLAIVPAAHAAITFNIAPGVFVSDGINPTVGTVDAFLTVTAPDDGVTLSGGFQVHATPGLFTGTITAGGVVFGVPGEASVVHPDQFPAAAVVPLVAVPPTDVAATSIGPASTLGNNRGLMSIPFTVAAGQAGTFTLSFVTAAPQPSELYTPAFGNLPIAAFNPGLITIVAAPEPSSMILGTVSLVGFAGVAWRKRKAAKAAAQKVEQAV